MKKKSSNSKKVMVSEVNKKESSKEQNEDISELILKDHGPIKKLILILKDSEVKIAKKKTAYNDFEKILSLHAKAEEKSLYVHMKTEDELRIEGLEGDVEHLMADRLMKEISQIENDDDLWMAKVKVLSEIVDHHVKEEEKEVLKQVRSEFDSAERIEIGKEYLKLISQLSGQLNTERSTKMKSSSARELMRVKHV